MTAAHESKTVLADPAGRRRATAVALGVPAAVLCIVVAAALIAIALVDDHTAFVEQEALAVMQKEVERQPANEALTSKLRDLDHEIRRRYFHRRRLVSVGAVLFLVGSLMLLCALRLYFFIPVEALRPTLPQREVEHGEKGAASRASSRSFGIALSGGLTLAALALFAVFPSAGTRGPDGEKGRDGAAAFARNWPQFRGPTSSGIVPAGDWPKTWDGKTGKNIDWKVPIPVGGRSSPVVWDDRIYLTGGDEKASFVMAFDRSRGTLLWKSKVVVPAAWKRDPSQKIEPAEYTGWAAPTPVTNGRFICAFFATADMACFDRRGRQVWGHNFGLPDSNYGLASSPVLDGKKVILQLDQGGDPEDKLSMLVAFDLARGRVLWKTARPVPNSWSSPIVIDTGKRREIITCADPWVIAYDPEDGKELWRVDGLSGDVAPTPIFVGGVIYATNTGSQLMAIRPGGSGDVTKTHLLWKDRKGLPDTASPACDGKHILQVLSHGPVTCHDAVAGKRVWRKDMGAGFNASPVLVGSTAYLFDLQGKTHVFALGKKYEAPLVSKLGETVEASPAFVGGRIYLRGQKNLYCIGPPRKATGKAPAP